MARRRVADPLREYASLVSEYEETVGADLFAIADEVDAEHARRMAQSRRETKRAALRYLRSVMEDYFKRDMKRSREDMLARYERKMGH